MRGKPAASALAESEENNMATTEAKEMIKKFVSANKEGLKQYFKSFTEAMHRRPCLVILQVGENKASESYIRGKVKDGEEMGVDMVVRRIPDTIPAHSLRREIYSCDDDPNVDAVMLQLPIPERMDVGILMDCINVAKDVDGFNSRSKCYPCTPLGIISFINALGVDTAGKNAVVIGRSDIVGKPMADMLLSKDCSVTVCHSKTPKEELERYIANADILVVAAGKRGLITKDMKFKPSAIVMDVGINVDEEGHLHGDCEPDLPVLFQSPVPGGVGLLTRLSLFFNFQMLIPNRGKKNGK